MEKGSVKPFELNGLRFDVLNPYIIAEIGVNHEGDLDRAKRMVEAAARGGAHAAKFQSFKADLLAAKGLSPAYWDQSKEAADSQYALFARWDNFGESEYRALADTCRDCGVDFMSTPFDLTAVNLVAELSPAIKIASADVTNIPLLRAVGETRLPVIMSTGACRFDEIGSAVQELERIDCRSLALLHCVLNYPTPPERAQMALFQKLSRIFGSDHAIGYSDHVKPDEDGSMPVLDMAVMFGAVIVEKHFTDDKSGTGNDHYHAMDEHDLSAFVERLRRFRTFYGQSFRDFAGEQAAIQNARRRIVSSRDLKQGQIIEPDQVIALRSNEGIEISHWDRVVGQELTQNVSGGTPLEWAHIK